MKARIIRIGKLQGICLPHILLKRAQLSGDVTLLAKPGQIVISKNIKPRDGWAAAARHMRAQGEDHLLYPSTSTRFDEKEWAWP